MERRSVAHTFDMSSCTCDLCCVVFHSSIALRLFATWQQPREASVPLAECHRQTPYGLRISPLPRVFREELLRSLHADCYVAVLVCVSLRAPARKQAQTFVAFTRRVDGERMLGAHAQRTRWLKALGVRAYCLLMPSADAAAVAAAGCRTRLACRMPGMCAYSNSPPQPQPPSSSAQQPSSVRTRAHDLNANKYFVNA